MTYKEMTWFLVERTLNYNDLARLNEWGKDKLQENAYYPLYQSLAVRYHPNPSIVNEWMN